MGVSNPVQEWLKTQYYGFMSTPDLLSKEQVMERLGGISESTFKRLCWAGELERVYPRYNIMRVTRESYERYLEKTKAQTTQPVKGTPYGKTRVGGRSSVKGKVAGSSQAVQSTPAPSLGAKVRSLFGFKGAGTD